VLERWRRSVARWIAPSRKAGVRSYSGAANNRLTTGFGNYSNTSADSELNGALTALRSRSRQLLRDAPYAKRARSIVVNNVLGSGVGMQAQVKNSRGELHQKINADIEAAWEKWTRPDSCHTGGAMHFFDLERTCLSEVFTAGEAFPRKHYRAFGNSRIPFALELIEAERVADEFTHPQGAGPAARLGVELDPFGRPVAYFIRTIHPGELRFTADQTVQLERVPASDIIHLRKIDRWPQTRGEPWLHAVVRKLNDMDGYSEAEIIAARSAASYMGMIETPDMDNPIGEPQTDGTQQLELSPGMIERLGPGEKFNAFMPNRPNTALDPFMRYMLREVAMGIPGLTYETISGDYSQSNFSSSRLGVVDSRDDWRILQKWWARSFREPLHREWMQAEVLSGGIPSISVEQFALDPDRFCAVSWKFRGWTFYDPTKDVAAFKDAVRCGFTTVQAVIQQTGGGMDIEDVLEQRRHELDDMAELDLQFETDPVAFPAKAPAAVEPAAPAAAIAPMAAPETNAEDAVAAGDQTPPARVLKMRANA
jgi:lambda family phage portal protein